MSIPGGRPRIADAVDGIGPLPAFLDELEILRPIGAGAMGRVYEARTRDGRRLALKTLPGAHPRDIARFKGEFRRFVELPHDNLVRLDRFVERDDHACWYTMELVQGVPFDAWVTPGGTLDAERLKRGLRGLIRGVRAIHAAGLLHRDLKPSNVLVEASGRVVVLDFGLAVPEGPGRDDADAGLRALQQAPAAGTPLFMAPEQGLGADPAAAADWYALGVLLYGLLAGRPPFAEAAPLALLKQKLAGKAPHPTTVRALPPELHELADLAVRLLHPRPAARPTADDVAAAIGLGREKARPRRAPVFVGRTGELARLREDLRTASTGRPAAVSLLGPSGVGKTTLVERFLQGVRERDEALILAGRCRPDESVPYKAFDGVVEALAGWLGGLDDEVVDALLPRRAAETTAVFVVLKTVRAFAHERSRRPLPSDPVELRRRAFAGLRELLGRIAEQRPLVVALDDAHLGDADSARLLATISAEPDPPPMLLLATRRPDDIAPLTTVLDGLHWSRTEPLGPLPASDARDLARQLLRGGAEPRVDAVVAEAAGNPFLLEQLTEFPRDSGPTEGRVGRLLEQRLAGSPATDRALLRILALARRPVPRAAARRAARLPDDDGPIVARLRSLRLVRTHGPADTDGLELYHDRLRPALLVDQDVDALQPLHLAIAEALEAERSDDWRALADHFADAGEPNRAVEYAVRAARRSADALAWDQAAGTFGRAVALGAELPPERRAELRLEQAEALVLAGRSGSAAAIFAAAAPHLPTGPAQRARRREAESLLVSGRIDAGTDRLRALLEDSGLRWPTTPARVTGGIVLGLLRLGLRGTRFRTVSAQHLTPAAQRRVDVCAVAAKGLLAVDSSRGAYFALRSLLLALALGEAGRIGRSMASVACGVLAPAGLTAWARRMLAAAERLAARGDDPLLRGAVSVAAGQTHVLAGEWRQALALTDRGMETLSGVSGAGWERSIGHMGAIRALEELGRYAEVAARTRAYKRQGEEAGDRYTTVTAQLFEAAVLLAEDAPASARTAANDALQAWGREELDIQRWYAVRVLVRADLYEGEPAAAASRLDAIWGELEASLLMRAPIVRIDAQLLRGTVAAATGRGGEVRRTAKALRREKRRDSAAHAAVLQACFHAASGRPGEAAGALREAETAYIRADMEGRADVARHALGFLLGRAGDGLRETARASLLERGVQRPARWTAMEVPGIVPR